MITEIFVEGQHLDVTADISSLLTFAIDDIKDFATRQTTFSKTVVLPGTANNNRIFGSIFDTGISNNYDPAQSNTGFNFNPSVSAKCIIFQDLLQTFKGTLRLIEIDIDLHRFEYQVALNGNLTGLNVALSSALLEDLDFSAYDQLYTVANIVASWNNPGGSGVYYPHIDYGTFSIDKHNWEYQTFKPALYVKEYIDKMFAATGNSSVAVIAGKLAGDAAASAALAGGATPIAAKAAYDAAYAAAFTAALPAAAAGVFRYQCDLFNTPRFKNLIVPHNQKALQALNSLLLTCAVTGPKTVLTSAGTATTLLNWDTAVGSIFTITGPTSTFQYNGTTALATITFNMGGHRHSLLSNFILEVLVNGTPLAAVTFILNCNHSSFNIPWVWHPTFNLAINAGDIIQFRFTADSAATDTDYILEMDSATLTINTSSNVLTPVLLNDRVQMNTAIPKNVRQIDFLLSIVQLFNLYVYEDQFDDRLIHITPFINFYDQPDPQKFTSVQCEASASAVQTQSISSGSPGNFGYDTLLGTDFTLTDAGPTGFKRLTYTGAGARNINIDIKSDGFFSASVSVSGSIELYHVRGGVTTMLDHYPLSSSVFPYAYNAHFFHNNFTIQPGDYFYVQVNDINSGTFTQNNAIFKIFTNVSAIIDWTYKLDRNEIIKVKPMSELNSRLYNFTYKDDGDYYNDLYKKRYNQGYGSFIFDSLFEFATQTNTITLIFASTPLVGYGGEDKVYPTIFKRSGVTEETIDSVIRVMQAKKLSCSSWNILAADGVTVLASENAYGYAGHLDDPNNPDNDLNFGALNELFFILAIGDLSKTQFNIYWSAYMAEITNKDSKLLTAKFYLRPIDIFNLDFSRYITVDGTLFRLNKIVDYNASMPGVCEIQLLKVINTSYSYPIGGIPEAARTLDWETGDELEYSPGLPLLYS